MLKTLKVKKCKIQLPYMQNDLNYEITLIFIHWKRLEENAPDI